MADEKREEHRTQEIVLIRRRSDGDHDEPHGGVWKVAFADFMTAMMAFFLVLWIVNSTTKETRSSVARYFNPVRLSDTTPARKGLKDPREEDFDAAPESTPSKKASSGAAGGDPARSSVTAEHKSTPIERSSPAAGAGASPAGAIDAFEDPFARRPQLASTTDGAPSAAQSRVQDGNDRANAKALLNELAASLGEEFSKLGHAIEVDHVADGLLVSLVDQTDFGMFAIGSANPEPRLLHVLGAIGAALQSRGGRLIIRGHTDARPFRAGSSDNWQLSFARAETAYHALVADGVDDARIERIEAYADHRLKAAGAPDAPQNRRIEILIRQEGK